MKKLLRTPALKKWLPAVIVLIYLMPIILVKAAFTGYLKIPDIDGESTDSDHKEWIDILSVSSGISRPVSVAGSSRVVGNPAFQEVIFVKRIDKSTPVLMENICKGKVFPKVEIELKNTEDAGRVSYLKYKLENVLITSFSSGDSTSGDTVPTENVSLNFTKIEMSSSATDSQGNVLYSTNVTCDVDGPSS